MRALTCYESEDGKLFRNESSCIEHEHAVRDAAEATQALQDGANLYQVLTIAHRNRGWCWFQNYKPEDLVALMAITKDTALIISHWQCEDRPGYRVQGINKDGYLCVWGDAGAWSGAYGNDDVSLMDLLRYYHDTVSALQRRLA